jgi:hypothetical protein
MSSSQSQHSQVITEADCWVVLHQHSCLRVLVTLDSTGQRDTRATRKPARKHFNSTKEHGWEAPSPF